MATVLYDRVKETCTATGVGVITLTGAIDGTLQDYADRYADGDLVPYCVIEANAAWEVGEGIFTLSGTTIARTAAGVISSSNADGLVVFTGNNKECFASLTAADLAGILQGVKTNSQNIALLHFYRAIDHGLSVQDMVDGFVDQYSDETGVTPGYVAEYDAAGDFYTQTKDSWDVTAITTYDNAAYITGDESTPLGIWVGDDGNRFYLLGPNATITQYSLTNPWNILGRSKNGVYAGGVSSSGLAFGKNGEKLYILTSNSIAQYDLTTPWDVLGVVTATTQVATSTSLRAIDFNADGTKVYLLIDTTTCVVRQYSLTTPWDVAGGWSLDIAYSIHIDQADPYGISFSRDGVYMYVSGGIPVALKQYTLAVPWDLTSAVTKSGFFALTVSNHARVSGDGLKYHNLRTANDRVEQFDLAAQWFVSTLLEESYTVAAGQTDGLFFSPDGLTMFTVTQNADRVQQFALSTAWSIASGVSLSGSLSLSGQTTPTGLCFDSAGTRLYVIGDTTDNVLQYNLTTPWVVTSGATKVSEFDITAQASASTEVRISEDGTRLYCLDNTGNDINQYLLSRSYAINNELLGIKAIESGSQDVRLSADGSKLYTITATGDHITQHSLATPWNIYEGVTEDGTLDVSPYQTLPTGFAFNSAGTKLYIIGELGDDLTQLGLSVAWDVTSTVSKRSFFDLTSIGTLLGGVFLSDDDLKLFVLDNTGNDVTQYTLGVAGDIAAVSEGTHAIPASSKAISFSSDGFTAYAVGYGDLVTQYSLTSAWVTSSGVTTDGSYSVAGQQADSEGLAFSSDGTKMYVLGLTPDVVSQYTLTTAWDVTGTVSYNGDYSVSGQGTAHTGLAFSSDGTKMYCVDNGGNDVNQYTLTTAWDVTGTVTFNGQYSVVGQENTPTDIFFKSDGLSMYILSSAKVHRYTLTSAWNVLGGMTFESTWDTTEWLTACTGVFFKSDGTKIFLSNSTVLSEISLLTAWEPEATMSKDGAYSIATDAPSARGFCFDPSGLNMYVVSVSNLVHYTLTTPWVITSGVSVTSVISVLYATEGAGFLGVHMSSDGNNMYLQGDELAQLLLSTSLTPGSTTTFQGAKSVGAQASVPTGLDISPDGFTVLVTDTAAVYQYTLTTAWDMVGGSTYNGSSDLTHVSGGVVGVFMGESGRSLFVCDAGSVLKTLTPLDYFPMDLSSISKDALSQPDEGYVVLLEEDIEDVTLNTDLVVSVSRDGGTTYSPVTLDHEGLSTEGLKILAGSVDISSQPDGTAMRYKVTSTTSRSKVHGASLQWG